MTVVVDDALLLSVLAGAAPAEVSRALQRGDLFTTGSWYYRLARAAHDRAFSGVLSTALSAVPSPRQGQVLAALDALPESIGLLHIRRLVPIMRRLDGGRRLNFLTAEALAAALSLDAAVLVTTESPLLSDAARAVGVEVRRVAVSR